MTFTSSITRRLVVVFTSLVLALGAVSLATLAALADIRDGIGRMEQHGTGARVALELASAVRDHYAHQAHTIILGNSSHMAYYAEAKQVVLRLTRKVRDYTEQPDEVEWVDDIERAIAELDLIFREHIVPAVMAEDEEAVMQEHSRAQEVVSLIQERTARLVKRFESEIDEFQDRVETIQGAARRRTLALLVLAPLLAIGIGLYMGRSVARPVARLQAGAKRLEAGDLETRIQIDSHDEFGELAHRINGMTAALKDHQEKLVQSEKLAGIGRLAAGVAHEINNPLGVILGYTRLLERRADGTLAEDLKVIEEEALRCQEIVEGLLDLSRPFRPLAETVDLRADCDEVAERLHESALLQSVRIAVDGEGTVVGHPAKLRQVLLNLIKNAAEAASPAGRVQVEVVRENGECLVRVGDSGAGIPPETRGALFEPFCTTKPSGTGLGLAISRTIARAHGGDIDVGESPLGGAQFTLRLPGRKTPGAGTVTV